LAQQVLAPGVTPRQPPIITVTTTVYLPVTLVFQRDAYGRVVRVITVYGDYGLRKLVEAGSPLDLRRIEDIIRYATAAQRLGVDPLDVLFSYVPPPPPYAPVAVRPPPDSPELRRFWERDTANALMLLSDVNTRRMWLVDQLARLRPLLTLRLGVDRAEKVIAHIQSEASKASSVWDLYRLEQLASSVDSLVALANQLT